MSVPSYVVKRHKTLILWININILHPPPLPLPIHHESDGNTKRSSANASRWRRYHTDDECQDVYPSLAPSPSSAFLLKVMGSGTSASSLSLLSGRLGSMKYIFDSFYSSWDRMRIVIYEVNHAKRETDTENRIQTVLSNAEACTNLGEHTKKICFVIQSWIKGYRSSCLSRRTEHSYPPFSSSTIRPTFIHSFIIPSVIKGPLGHDIYTPRNPHRGTKVNVGCLAMFLKKTIPFLSTLTR